MQTGFEYKHIVGFEETNLVGNVYYVNQLRWQGRCRELFLREFAPDLLYDLQNGLSLVTLHCSCTYLSEVFAFDEIVMSMQLASISQSRMTMIFDCFRCVDSARVLSARGEQQIACMRRELHGLVPAHLPERLRNAAQRFQSPGLGAHADTDLS